MLFFCGKLYFVSNINAKISCLIIFFISLPFIFYFSPFILDQVNCLMLIPAPNLNIESEFTFFYHMKQYKLSAVLDFGNYNGKYNYFFSLSLYLFLAALNLWTFHLVLMCIIVLSSRSQSV